MSFEVYLCDDLVAIYSDGALIATYSEARVMRKCKRLAVDFLESRVPAKREWNDNYRRTYGLQTWDPEAICRITHGMTVADSLWIKFPEDDENLNWEQIQKLAW